MGHKRAPLGGMLLGALLLCPPALAHTPYPVHGNAAVIFGGRVSSPEGAAQRASSGDPGIPGDPSVGILLAILGGSACAMPIRTKLA